MTECIKGNLFLSTASTGIYSDACGETAGFNGNLAFRPYMVSSFLVFGVGYISCNLTEFRPRIAVMLISIIVSHCISGSGRLFTVCNSLCYGCLSIAVSISCKLEGCSVFIYC